MRPLSKASWDLDHKGDPAPDLCLLWTKAPLKVPFVQMQIFSLVCLISADSPWLASHKDLWMDDLLRFTVAHLNSCSVLEWLVWEKNRMHVNCQICMNKLF